MQSLVELEGGSMRLDPLFTSGLARLVPARRKGQIRVLDSATKTKTTKPSGETGLREDLVRHRATQNKLGRDANLLIEPRRLMKCTARTILKEDLRR